MITFKRLCDIVDVINATVQPKTPVSYEWGHDKIYCGNSAEIGCRKTYQYTNELPVLAELTNIIYGGCNLTNRIGIPIDLDKVMAKFLYTINQSYSDNTSDRTNEKSIYQHNYIKENYPEAFLILSFVGKSKLIRVNYTTNTGFMYSLTLLGEALLDILIARGVFESIDIDVSVIKDNRHYIKAENTDDTDYDFLYNGEVKNENEIETGATEEI